MRPLHMARAQAPEIIGRIGVNLVGPTLIQQIQLTCLVIFQKRDHDIDAAEGGRVAAVFRHLGVGGNYFYRNPEDIRTDAPEDYQKYYAEVKSGTLSEQDFEEIINYAIYRLGAAKKQGAANPAHEED